MTDPITQFMMLGAAGASGDDNTYIDDIFNSEAYKGVGGTQQHVNGIDLAGEGGLVWIKAFGISNVIIFLFSYASIAQVIMIISLEIS